MCQDSVLSPQSEKTWLGYNGSACPPLAPPLELSHNDRHACQQLAMVPAQSIGLLWLSWRQALWSLCSLSALFGQPCERPAAAAPLVFCVPVVILLLLTWSLNAFKRSHELLLSALTSRRVQRFGVSAPQQADRIVAVTLNPLYSFTTYKRTEARLWIGIGFTYK